MGKLSLLFVAILFALLTIPAMAQQALPALTVTANKNAVTLGPNQTAVVTWTITNTGSAPGTATVTMTPPSGWEAALQGDASFPLQGAQQGGNSRQVTATIQPSAAPGANGDLVFSVTIRDNVPGQMQVRDTEAANVALTYDAPEVIPPPPPPAKDYTWHWVAGVGSLVFLGGYVAQAGTASIRPYQRNMRINVGTDGWMLIHVRNRSLLPSRVQLRVRGLEGRYVAAFSSPEVRLGPRESLQIPLLVKVPTNAKRDEHVQFQIQARPNGFSPWLARREVSFDTLDVTIGGPSPIPPNA